MYLRNNTKRRALIKKNLRDMHYVKVSINSKIYLLNKKSLIKKSQYFKTLFENKFKKERYKLPKDIFNDQASIRNIISYINKDKCGKIINFKDYLKIMEYCDYMLMEYPKINFYTKDRIFILNNKNIIHNNVNYEYRDATNLLTEYVNKFGFSFSNVHISITMMINNKYTFLIIYENKDKTFDRSILNIYLKDDEQINLTHEINKKLIQLFRQNQKIEKINHNKILPSFV